MIYLYSGTPGSGKSLNTARFIMEHLRYTGDVICNFPINKEFIKGRRMSDCTCVDNEQLTVPFLIQKSIEYFQNRKFKEGKLLLIIDEAQLLFNAREWDIAGRKEWTSFFTQHRKYGYDIILVAQFDRMLDRQIRSLLEYEYIHRKVSNFGIGGKVFSLASGGNLFCVVKMWYPLKEKIGVKMFKLHKKYFRLYDSYMTFNGNSAV